MFTKPFWISTFQNSFSAIFDGIDERVELSDIVGLEFNTTMSIGLWVKSNALDGTFRTMFGGGLDSNIQPRLQLLISDSNKYSFFVRDNAGLNSGVVEGNLEDDNWHFLVLVRNGSNWELFDNAVSAATKTFSPGAFGLNAFDLGALTSDSITSGFFEGKLDEIAVWNTNLSLSDITRLYTKNGGIPSDLLRDTTAINLLRWWRFIQRDINNFPIIVDNSGSGIDGITRNMEVGDIQTDVP